MGGRALAEKIEALSAKRVQCVQRAWKSVYYLVWIGMLREEVKGQVDCLQGMPSRRPVLRRSRRSMLCRAIG
jgi:hypothetical protein